MKDEERKREQRTRSDERFFKKDFIVHASGFMLLAMLAAACNNVTQPQQLNGGSFIADMEDAIGSPFYFSATDATVSAGTDYSVHADEQGGSEFSLDGLQTGLPLPYTVTSAQGAKITYYDNKNGQTYYSNYGNCVVTISQTSPTLVGSFTGRLVCTASVDSLRLVSSGSFNATFQ